MTVLPLKLSVGMLVHFPPLALSSVGNDLAAAYRGDGSCNRVWPQLSSPHGQGPTRKQVSFRCRSREGMNPRRNDTRNAIERRPIPARHVRPGARDSSPPWIAAWSLPWVVLA